MKINMKKIIMKKIYKKKIMMKKIMKKNLMKNIIMKKNGMQKLIIKIIWIDKKINETEYLNYKNDLTDIGYEVKTFYSIKNDEQLQAAKDFINEGVDYLLISAAETTGWDAVLKDAKKEGLDVKGEQYNNFIKEIDSTIDDFLKNIYNEIHDVLY